MTEATITDITFGADADAEASRTESNPHTEPSWEAAIVSILHKVAEEWTEAGFSDEQIDEIPELAPLPSESKHGIRLTYGEYECRTRCHHRSCRQRQIRGSDGRRLTVPSLRSPRAKCHP